MPSLTLPRVAVLAALVTIAGCGDTAAAPGTMLAPSGRASLITTAEYTYASLGAPVTYGVTGPFEDIIHFTATAAGTYQVSAVGNTQIVGCSGRYCMSPGTLKATISSAQVQTAQGVPVATLSGTTAVALQPGDYILVVDGTGVGTKRYLNQGNFTVTIRAPAVVPSCDYVRDLLQTQGYTEVQIESMVAAMQAASPPKCSGD